MSNFAYFKSSRRAREKAGYRQIDEQLNSDRMNRMDQSKGGASVPASRSDQSSSVASPHPKQDGSPVVSPHLDKKS